MVSKRELLHIFLQNIQIQTFLLSIFILSQVRAQEHDADLPVHPVPHRAITALRAEASRLRRAKIRAGEIFKFI